MKISGIDHIVLTTSNLEACLKFYGELLGLEVVHRDGRYALHFGSSKINIHTRPAEFLPAARHPQAGSLDICLVADGPIEEIRQELLAKGISLEQDVVERHGAMGKMKSMYLRDLDGNLVEICSYINIDG